MKVKVKYLHPYSLQAAGLHSTEMLLVYSNIFGSTFHERKRKQEAEFVLFAITVHKADLTWNDLQFVLNY